MAIDDLAKVFGVVQSGLTSLGIVVGALWAYYQYFRGRTFKPRLEPKLTATASSSGNGWLVIASAVLKNVGLSKLPISQEGTALRVFAGRAIAGSSGGDGIEWMRLHTFPAFEPHRWIEPGETIGDTVALSRGVLAPVAFKCELRIVANKIEWNTTTIVDAVRGDGV